MKIWKRCAAALLALIMMVTSVSFGFAAGRIDGETGIWSATAAEIVAEQYGISDDRFVAAVLDSPAVDAGFEYTAEVPHENGTEGKQDLLVVDYLNKVVYARSFESNGLRWIPDEAVLSVEGEVQETFVLTESVSYYNNEEFYASAPFAYDGKRYTIEVTYSLPLDIDVAEQQRILDIPAHLMQAAKNTDTTLARMRSNLDLFGREIPTLNKMLTMYLPAEEGEEAEPFFDGEEHAAEIAAITALFAEYTKNEETPQLDLLALSGEAWDSELNSLAYAMEDGLKVKETAEALYEKLSVLNESQRLRILLSQIKKVDTEAHTSLKALYKYMGRIITPLEELQSDDSWMILDESVQASIFKEGYTAEELDALSATATSLKGYIAPTATAETFVPVRGTVSCEIVTHDVEIVVSAKVVGEGIGNAELTELTPYSDTIRVLDGLTQQELAGAILVTGVEEEALRQWNGLDDAYKIDESHYVRTTSAVDGVLSSDINYTIDYSPQEYTVNTNYGMTLTVPFGYLLELPVCVDGDGWYDYRVVLNGGGEISYNQGSVFAVEANMEIFRTTGTAKFEYRVLDYLADDPQYGMNDLAKKILYNTALNSPMVRIRVPGENISPIVDTGAGFYVKAEKLASGMAGMSWIVDGATLYDGKSVVHNLSPVEGKISWETAGFTHLMIDHSMEITRVRDGALSRPLSESEINGYANLPYELSAEVGAQQRALSGDERGTAKSTLEMMEDYEWIMSLLKNSDEREFFEYMSTAAGKNAIRLLTSSESMDVKGVNGEPLGKGGWSKYNTEMAALFYYLRKCESAGWSVATYYEHGYYEALAHHAELMGKCLQDIVDDAGFIAAAKAGGYSSQVQSLKNVIPVLEKMVENMKVPNAILDVSHARFSSLIADLLAAEGNVRSYDNASTIYAYETVRRNGENFGSLQVTVQKDSIARTETIDYELETVNGSERYHIVTPEEAAFLQSFVAEAEADLNLDAEEKQYHDCYANGSIPNAGEHLKGSKDVIFLYTPKTYTVTIDGVSTSEYMETFRYGEPYTIDLPAKNDAATPSIYYEYTFYDENGEVLDVVGVENGSVGHFTFTKEQLPKLFPYGTYVIYRKECIENGVPTTLLKPQLTAEWIRGAVEDKWNRMLFLDALPKSTYEGITYEGLTYERFKEQVQLEVQNGKLLTFEILDAEGYELKSDALVATGMTIHHVMENVYGKEVEGNLNGYTIIMMGDVNYDGKCDDADARAVAETYFLERDKEGKYIEPPELNFRLAANMNNNATLDSNDAWFIRSKVLHWNGQWNKQQITYRTVLR